MRKVLEGLEKTGKRPENGDSVFEKNLGEPVPLVQPLVQPIKSGHKPKSPSPF